LNFFTSQFQTENTCNYYTSRLDCDLAFALASLRARAMPEGPMFIALHALLEGWLV